MKKQTLVALAQLAAINLATCCYLTPPPSLLVADHGARVVVRYFSCRASTMFRRAYILTARPGLFLIAYR